VECENKKADLLRTAAAAGIAFTHAELAGLVTAYLEDRKKVQPSTTEENEIEYVSALMKLRVAENARAPQLAEALLWGGVQRPSLTAAAAVAAEKAVQKCEQKLNMLPLLSTRWTPESENYIRVSRLLAAQQLLDARSDVEAAVSIVFSLRQLLGHGGPSVRRCVARAWRVLHALHTHVDVAFRAQSAHQGGEPRARRVGQRVCLARGGGER
jgi:hypothetical protein